MTICLSSVLAVFESTRRITFSTLRSQPGLPTRICEDESTLTSLSKIVPIRFSTVHSTREPGKAST